MYAHLFKRILDFLLSLFALIILFPFLLILTILGIVFMQGNPFFTQERPGKDEKLFRLVKFRSMNNKKDNKGRLLPDELRINTYGKLLRSTSLDELPEIINILKGDMSIVGPRPLLPKDVANMNAEQHRRHLVRPGLTGLAQCTGRNALNWDLKLNKDIEYVDNLTFRMDFQIIMRTILKVLKREDVTFADGADMDLKEWNELKMKQNMEMEN